jgi:hypothetical protein
MQAGRQNNIHASDERLDRRRSTQARAVNIQACIDGHCRHLPRSHEPVKSVVRDIVCTFFFILGLRVYKATVQRQLVRCLRFRVSARSTAPLFPVRVAAYTVLLKVSLQD